MRVIGPVDGVGRIGKEERIAVGHRPDHVFGADIVGGAGPVFDHELAVKAARQPISDQPRHHVDRAAGGKADNDLDRPGRIVGREGAARNGRQRGSPDCQLQERAARKCHGITPEVPLDGGPRISASLFLIFKCGSAPKPIPIARPSPETERRGVHLVMLGEAERPSETSEAIQRPAIATRFRGAA